MNDEEMKCGEWYFEGPLSVIKTLQNCTTEELEAELKRRKDLCPDYKCYWNEGSYCRKGLPGTLCNIQGCIAKTTSIG